MGLGQHHKVAGVSLDSDLPAMDFADAALDFQKCISWVFSRSSSNTAEHLYLPSFSRRKLFFAGGKKLGILQSNFKQTQPSKTHGNKNDNKEERHWERALWDSPSLSWHLLALPFPPRWYFCPWSWGAQRLLLLCSSYQQSCSWLWPYHGLPPNTLPPTSKSYCLQQSVCLNQGSLLIIVFLVFFHDVQMPSLTNEDFNIVLRLNGCKVSV